MCGEHGCRRVCHCVSVHMTKVSVSSVLSPLLGCRGLSRKNNQGSHPISPWPHFHCISNYCSQTQIKHQVELQSQGTWMGGRLKREVGVFLVKEREREMEGNRDRGVSICLLPLEGRLDRVLSLAQGAYADSMTFFPGTRFYT